MNLIDLVNKHICNPTMIDKRARLSHYPSEASVYSRLDGTCIGKCHRAVSYKWLDTPSSNPIDARGMWTFAVGKMIEAGYVEYTKQIGIWVANNLHIYDTLRNISGEVDLIVKDAKDLIGVEIKTAYGYGFQNSVLKFPKMENLLQVGIYADYFADTIKEWHLVYKARDTQEEVEYIITMDKDEIGKFLVVNHTIPVKQFYIEDIYARFQALGEIVCKKELARRDYVYGYSLDQSKERLKTGAISKTKLAKVEKGVVTDSDWNCLYCEYLDLCWSEKRKEFKMKQVTDAEETV